MDLELLTRLYAEHVDTLSRDAAAALRASGLDAMVVHSGSPKKRSEFDDQYWPLRPVPHFHHWCPLAQPDCALVFVPGKKPTLAWSKHVDYWEQPAKPETTHFTTALDVVETRALEDVKKLVPPGRVAFVGEDASRAAAWGLDLVNPPALVAALDATRVRKSPYEVLCLEEANRRAARGHAAVLAAFEAGLACELDLHLEYLRATRQDDAETPYKNIVALGRNAAVLHHVAYVKHPSGAPAQSLLVDAGATYQGYASDVTRTWVNGTGATAAAFAALLDGMERMQQSLCAAVTVGRPYEELHDESHRRLAGVLRDAGIARLSEGELVASGITRAFLPHGLGHSLGLQTHDVGCALVKPKAENPWLRNTSPVTVGQCFTIEPGVYFIDALLAPLRARHADGIDWRLVDELAAFGGIRIEDDLVVTGGDRVTRNLTREVLPRGGGAVTARRA